MLGARVAIMRDGGSTIRQRARADGSNASANDPRMLIGLGTSADAPLVRVQWPSGWAEESPDVAIDEWTTLRNGSGNAPVETSPTRSPRDHILSGHPPRQRPRLLSVCRLRTPGDCCADRSTRIAAAMGIFYEFLRDSKRDWAWFRDVLRHPVAAAGRLFYRAALLRYWRPQRPGATIERRELLERTEAYNTAAERYFAEHAEPQFLLDKPFSDSDGFPQHLIRAGTLIAAGRIQPGDTVVEIGAGTCWLSHFLNRYGCRTVAVDVSRTALKIGKKLFARELSTNWSLEPRFVPYDGHTLPLDDATADCIVVYDAFHHIPNQHALLTEMHRILRPRGMVVMSEPGVGHADKPASIAERETGVLENELVVADIAALAGAVGFRDTRLLVSTPYFRHEIPAGELGRFLGGGGFADYWANFSEGMTVHHYILMYGRSNVPTTERPGGVALLAAIGIEEAPHVHDQYTAGKHGRAVVSIENRGDAVWLHAEGKGWTRLGGHLFAVKNGSRELVDFDWLRVEFGQDIEPEDRIVVEVDLPAIERPGSYEVEFDVVLEGVTWFTKRGSQPTCLGITVE